MADGGEVRSGYGWAEGCVPQAAEQSFGVCGLVGRVCVTAPAEVDLDLDLELDFGIPPSRENRDTASRDGGRQSSRQEESGQWRARTRARDSWELGLDLRDVSRI